MYPSPENPGYGVFVKNVIKGLEKEKIKTLYISTISGRGKNILLKCYKYIAFYISIFVNYFKTYDCIYVHFPTYSAPILYLLMFIKKNKLVINFHGEDLLYQDESKLQQKLGIISDKLTKRFATFVVVPSKYYKDIVLKRNLINETNIVISPSGGIDHNIFYNCKNKKEKEYFHLGFVGRFEKLKGILEFIDTCLILSNKHKIKVTIIGYGPLNELVKEKTKGYKFFEIIYGVSQSELPKYYHQFDLFYFPSKRKTESLGLVGIEAMACGVPIIASNIGGITSYLQHKKNGYISNVDNLINDMVENTETYLNLSEEDKRTMKESCIRTSLEYNKDFVCKMLAKEFQSRINIYKNSL